MQSVIKYTATTKNIQWTWQLIFHTASFVWKVYFSIHKAHIKIYETSLVNFPLSDEVTINTMFHASENSYFLRNAIYAFTIQWCRTAEVGWLATCRFNIMTPSSGIKQSKKTVGHGWLCKCTQHGASDGGFSGTGALVTTVNPSLPNFSVFTPVPQFLHSL